MIGVFSTSIAFDLDHTPATIHLNSMACLNSLSLENQGVSAASQVTGLDGSTYRLVSDHETTEHQIGN